MSVNNNKNNANITPNWIGIFFMGKLFQTKAGSDSRQVIGYCTASKRACTSSCCAVEHPPHHGRLIAEALDAVRSPTWSSSPASLASPISAEQSPLSRETPTGTDVTVIRLCGLSGAQLNRRFRINPKVEPRSVQLRSNQIKN